MPNPKQSYEERVIEEYDLVWKMSLDILVDEGVGSAGKYEMVRDELRSFVSQALDNQMKEVTDLIASQVGYLKMRGQDYTQLQELYENLKSRGLI